MTENTNTGLVQENEEDLKRSDVRDQSLKIEEDLDHAIKKTIIPEIIEVHLTGEMVYLLHRT